METDTEETQKDKKVNPLEKLYLMFIASMRPEAIVIFVICFGLIIALLSS